MMKLLPDSVAPYKRTPVFTEETIPSSLKRWHTTKPGVWAKIHVVSGTLRYQILEPALEAVTLTPTRAGIIEPEVPHQVQPVGQVAFYVEFYR